MFPLVGGHIISTYELPTSMKETSIIDNSANNEKKLTNLKSGTKNILFEFQTSFPFDLFPDTIIIDENQVRIVGRGFFFNYHVRSIVIEDITDVSVDTGLFFAALTIVDSSNYRFPITEKIQFLSKQNAYTARKLIQGLILAKNKNINLSSIPLNKVRQELCELGESLS